MFFNSQKHISPLLHGVSHERTLAHDTEKHKLKKYIYIHITPAIKILFLFSSFLMILCTCTFSTPQCSLQLGIPWERNQFSKFLLGKFILLMVARINYISHCHINETRLNCSTMIFAFLIYSGVANVAKGTFFFHLQSQTWKYNYPAITEPQRKQAASEAWNHSFLSFRNHSCRTCNENTFQSSYSTTVR